MSDKPSKMDILERELIKFQKWAFVLLMYPLISCFSFAVVFFDKNYSLTLSFSSFRALYNAFNMEGFQSFITPDILAFVLSAVFLTLSIYLTLRAAKAKMLGAYVLTSFLFIDTIYTCFLIIPDIFNHFDLASYLISLVIHVVFLIFHLILILKYAKLRGLERKLNAR